MILRLGGFHAYTNLRWSLVKICEILRKKPKNRSASTQLQICCGSGIALSVRSLFAFWFVRRGDDLLEGERKRFENRPKNRRFVRQFRRRRSHGAALFGALFPRLRFTKARSDSANGLDCIPFALGFLGSLLLLRKTPPVFAKRIFSSARSTVRVTRRVCIMIHRIEDQLIKMWFELSHNFSRKILMLFRKTW